MGMQAMGDQSFDAQFNMGIKKLERIHTLLMSAHNSALSDNHSDWKLCLDALFREVYPYLDPKKDKPEEIKKAKDECLKLLMEYLNWLEKATKPEYKYAEQLKQLRLEESLDTYERLLFAALKNRNFDMPGHDDISRLTMKGRY